MQDAFLAYVQDPTPENFLAVRRVVIAEPGFRPYESGLPALRDAYEAGTYDHARDVFAANLPSLLLNGEAHFILALTHERLGNNELAQMEKYLSFACVRGILGSGDGTRETPYLVLSTADEYDALNALSKESKGQSLHHDAGRVLDCHAVEGGDVWFDITEAFATLERQPGGN